MVDWSFAQAAVIGAGLRDGDCVPEILAETRPEDFSGEYRRLYEAFARLAAENVPVNHITVLNVTGPAYVELISELLKRTLTSADVSAYISVCREQSRLTLLRNCGTELSGAATLDDAREALGRAAAVSLETGRLTSWTAGECVREWFAALDAGEKPEYIESGVGSVDHTLRTVAGNFVIIAGYTSHGKSALALQMARGIARKKRVGFFSFETSKKEWTDRLISYAAKLPLDKIQDKALTKDDAQRCGRASAELYQLPLRYEHAAGFTLEDIRARVLRRRYEVIFVDYLQKIRPPRQRFGRYEAITEISGGLQTLAQQYGVTVYALSQLSRQQKSAEEYIPLPGLPDLRESGQIEQDADAVLFVHAPFKRSEPGFRMLDVAKNRSGILKSFYADFDGSVQTFSEPTKEHAERYRRLMAAKKIDYGGKHSGGRSFSRLRDTDPADNPFFQDALPI